MHKYDMKIDWEQETTEQNFLAPYTLSLMCTGEKTYSCGMCDRKFNCSKSVKEHEMTHTGEKQYSCKYCDKKFLYSMQLFKHNRTHRSEKP